MVSIQNCVPFNHFPCKHHKEEHRQIDAKAKTYVIVADVVDTESVIETVLDSRACRTLVKVQESLPDWRTIHPDDELKRGLGQ